MGRLPPEFTEPMGPSCGDPRSPDFQLPMWSCEGVKDSYVFDGIKKKVTLFKGVFPGGQETVFEDK